jgi:mitochondrial translocator assembly and maintenance protein 41
MTVSKDDYAGLAWLFGAPLLQFTTKAVFPWHSNHILLEDKKIKYSIVSQHHLRTDLNTWKYLSFAGRLQKAVLPLQPYTKGFEEDLRANR